MDNYVGEHWVCHVGGWLAATRLNGRRLSGGDWKRLAPGDRITIARVEVEFRPYEPVAYAPADAAERDLLAAIATDDKARLAYADLLEQRGDLARARYLRVQHEIMSASRSNRPRVPAPPVPPPTTGPFVPPGTGFADRIAELEQLAAVTQRISELEKLAADLPLAWRHAVARALVDGCSGFEAPCPRDWTKMTATSRSDVRFCTGCRKEVHYCATVEKARTHAMAGHCVAIDSTLVRNPYDVHPGAITSGMLPGPRRR